MTPAPVTPAADWTRKPIGAASRHAATAHLDDPLTFLDKLSKRTNPRRRANMLKRRDGGIASRIKVEAAAEIAELRTSLAAERAEKHEYWELYSSARKLFLGADARAEATSARARTLADALRDGREFLAAAEALLDWMNGNDLSADHADQKPEDYERLCAALEKFSAALAALPPSSATEDSAHSSTDRVTASEAVDAGSTPAGRASFEVPDSAECVAMNILSFLDADQKPGGTHDPLDGVASIVQQDRSSTLRAYKRWVRDTTGFNAPEPKHPLFTLPPPPALPQASGPSADKLAGAEVGR